MIDTEDFIPLEDATILSGKAESSIRLWIKNKKIDAKKDAQGHWKVSRNSLRNYLVSAGGLRPQLRPNCERNPAATAPSSASAVAELREEIKELKESLSQERSERLRALEAVYSLQEQVVALSSKVVGLLDAAGTHRNNLKAVDYQSNKPIYSSDKQDETINVVIRNDDWISTSDAEKLTGIPRQTLASRAKIGRIRCRKEGRVILLFKEDVMLLSAS